MTTKPKLLLHSCCGPCSTAVIERLIADYNVTVFFYNPCITEKEEYEKRKENQIFFINKYNDDNKLLGTDKEVHFVEGDYIPEDYFNVAKDFATEKEGGARCTECFNLRLEETAIYCKKETYDFFATTLTVSPHKNYNLISQIGKEMAGKYNVEYYDGNFKKQAGFQRSIELSKEYELYRQNYCGCVYSKRD